MNNDQLLTLLSTKQKDWIKMARSFGLDQDDANDIVQEMYIRIHSSVKDPDIIMYNEKEVNTCYIYVTLRNIFLASIKEKNKTDRLDEDDTLLSYDYDDVRDEMMTNLLILTETEISTWSWYDSKIYNLYFKQGYTLKKLSEETGISVSSIFNTIKNCKQRIKNNIGKKYEVFKKYEEN